MTTQKVFCSYEGEEFNASDFDGNGEHKNQEPRHLMTGALVRTSKDGPAPLDVEPPEE